MKISIYTKTYSIIIYILLIIYLFFSLIYWNQTYFIYEPIFLIYDQSSYALNRSIPLFLSLLFAFVGFIIGFLLSYVYCFFFNLFKIKLRENRIVYFFKRLRKKLSPSCDLKKKIIKVENIETQDFKVSFFYFYKKGFMASIFTFNISLQILQISDIYKFIVNEKNVFGNFLPIVFGFFGIMPWTIIISSALYSAIIIVFNSNKFLTYKINEEIIKRNNISYFFENVLKNYTTITTLFSIFTLTYNIYLDYINSGIIIPIYYILSFPLFIIIILPIYFIPIFLISNSLHRKYEKIFKS